MTGSHIMLADKNTQSWNCCPTGEHRSNRCRQL